MLQITRSAPVADVVIIGSGAGGGTVTKVLTDLGINVTLLEAGPMLHPETDFKEHKWPYDYPHRGSGDGGASYFGRGRDFGWFSAHAGGWELEGEPYTVAEGSKFQWFRSRIVGGRTNHYGRISLRYADYDFKPYSRDGIGTDWPISYDDIAPYYDKAETFIGVTGSKEGLRSAPDGIFQTCPPPRVHEVLIKKASDKLGIPCIPNRLAVITKPTNGRPACHYCGAMRARLHHGVELFLRAGADFPGDEDRPRDADHQRDGARADHRRRRQGQRGFLHRQDDAHRKTGSMPHGGAGGERLRIGAAAAEFESVRDT